MVGVAIPEVVTVFLAWLVFDILVFSTNYLSKQPIAALSIVNQHCDVSFPMYY